MRCGLSWATKATKCGCGWPSSGLLAASWPGYSATGAGPAERLRQALPAEYRTGTWYYTDEWEAYQGVFPAPAHRPSAKGSGQTSIVEAINCCLRQKCGVLVRKSCSFNRCEKMHQVRIQLVIDEHNRRLALS